MRIDHLVGADRRPARPFGLFFDRAHGRALLVDHDEELERGLAFRAGDTDDPRRLELAKHADIGSRVIGSANAELAILRLTAEASQVLQRRPSIPAPFTTRP